MSRRIVRGEWAIETLVPPSIEPLTLSQAKQQLSLTDDQTDFDGLITDYIYEARNFLEENYSVDIMPQQRRIFIGQFPYAETIRLPVWPIQAITAFNYYDIGGNENSLTVGLPSDQPVPDLIFSRSKKPCEVRLAFGKVWPSVVLQTADGIQMDVDSGFITGQSPEILPLPANIRRAMRLLIGHAFMNREAATVVGRPSAELVLGVREAMASVKFEY